MVKISNKQFEPIWEETEEKKITKKKQTTKKIVETVIETDIMSDVKFETIIEIEEPIILTMKDILSMYIKDNLQYKLYYNNVIIYDSKNSKYRSPVLMSDYFVIYDQRYYYKGMRIEKY
jgi:hypothetical protein